VTLPVVPLWTQSSLPVLRTGRRLWMACDPRASRTSATRWLSAMGIYLSRIPWRERRSHFLPSISPPLCSVVQMKAKLRLVGACRLFRGYHGQQHSSCTYISLPQRAHPVQIECAMQALLDAKTAVMTAPNERTARKLS